jgi:alanyl-tRNA synthetase
MPQSHPHALTADTIRRAFIEFFKGKPGGTAGGHTFVPSSPCAPLDDPTLLFTNAGMNQFKPIFLGQVDPNSDMGRLKRAVNSQKCIRAGGKHNDLEDVGKDTYHHTFFEMLGNWSFGDYFKKEAIEWSWELLTKIYKIPTAALYATYFEGNPKAGLEPDHETRELWLKFLPPDRVLPGNMKDNFWEMGETGPCGPCTEIHVDRLAVIGAGDEDYTPRNAASLVNQGNPDVIEIWNNVFIQFNRESDGTLKPLPAKHVDTGLGLERLVSVLQRKRSNYDTDIFAPIFAAIERLTNAPHPYMGRLGSHDTGNVDTAYRVIADHIRTLTFAITDGALPSNVGRGYVLRRILRRAVRYGRQMLGAKTGFFAQLVPVVVERFGEAFPELRKDPARVAKVILDEEESFGKTLDRGIFHFRKAWERAVASGTLKPEHLAKGGRVVVSNDDSGSMEIQYFDKQEQPTGFGGGTVFDGPNYLTLVKSWFTSPPVIRAEDAFLLYDTYGFPVDLTQLMAEERGLSVDITGFGRLMEFAKEKSRAGGKLETEKSLTLAGDQVARLKHLEIDPTDDSHKFELRDVSAAIRAIWNGQDFDEEARPNISHHGRTIGIVTDRTNFYAQMGGQEADTGRIEVLTENRSGNHERTPGVFVVESTQSFGGYVLHIGKVESGELRVGDTVQMAVDKLRRNQIAGNHTATHLTNLLLRQVLGAHVDQKGSLVAPDRMRFDFSHTQPVNAAELEMIERGVQERIRQNLPVNAKPAALHVSRGIKGLRAVFGETYPDPVRVVSIGKPVDSLLDKPGNDDWMNYSVEFCGGTHVQSTAMIGDFALISEEAVAKGIRRVVALSGDAATEAIRAAQAMEQRIKATEFLPDMDLPKAVAALSTDLEQTVMPSPRKVQLRGAIAKLQDKVKAASKQMAGAVRDQAVGQARAMADSAITANDVVVVGTVDAADDRQALQAAVKTVRDKLPRAAVMLMSVDEAGGKVAIMCAVPEQLIAKGLKAGDWLRDAAAVVGGKGGGKPDSAQGGGTDTSKVNDAIKAARTAALRLVM